MVKMPFGSDRGKNKRDKEFEPRADELRLIGPFLGSEEAVFLDVREAVLSSEISEERREPLLEYYKNRRSEKLAQISRMSERKG